MFQDFSRAQPVADVVFEAWRRFYSYERTPLNAVVEEVGDTPLHSWLERISFDAAYDDDRVVAYLFLPKNAEPPYQTIVYFASGNHDELARGTAGAGSVAHLRTRSKLFANPVEDRHRGDTRTAVAAQARFRGIDAIHGQPAHWTGRLRPKRGREFAIIETKRQHPAIVLQEHDRRASRFSRQRAVFCVPVHRAASSSST